MDNRSRGFRLVAAAVMLVFLLAVSAFAMAEADPIRVSSLSEPQSVISEQDHHQDLQQQPDGYDRGNLAL